MWRRFLIYGFLGWGVEVAFTGAHSLLFLKDRSARATSYLWMHPIYGLGGMALEWTGKWLRGRPRVARALAGTAAIYAIEYSSGWLLRRMLGRCPWDYGKGPFRLHGLVRFDYAPFWMGAAWYFEPLSRSLADKAAPALEATAAAIAGAATPGRTAAA